MNKLEAKSDPTKMVGANNLITVWDDAILNTVK